MYELNGVALDNAAKGWILQKGTRPYTGTSRAVESLRVPGRDGVVAGLSLDRDPVVVPIRVGMVPASVREFMALVDAAHTLSKASESVSTAVEVVSAEPEYPYAEPWVEVALILRIPSGVWRSDTETTSSAVSIGSASVGVAVLSGLSVPVQDAIVRVKGSITGLRVTDSSGSWFEYPPNIPSTSYLRFHSDTGEAYVTTSDTWTGGTDVSGVIDFNGPRGRFEITPSFTDPAVRVGGLTVTSSARSGASVQVRGRAAYHV